MVTQIKLKYIVLYFPLFFLTGCFSTDDMTEASLLSQLSGATCSSIADDQIYNAHIIEATYKPNCRRLSHFGRWWMQMTKRNFTELCTVSGAVCLLELPTLRSRTLSLLEEFLLTGMNDVDTGDGVFSIRGTTAIAYAILKGKGAVPVLEKALLRMDQTIPSESGSFPTNHVFEIGTSHSLIKKAIAFSQ